MNKLSHLYVLSVLAVGLCSCETPYRRTELDFPLSYRQVDHVETNKIIPDRWWEQFGDADLNRIVVAVLAQNDDLAAAGVRLSEANLEKTISRRNQFPLISANLASLTTNGGTLYTGSASISYQVDLWGRLSMMHSIAQWEAKATAQDLRATRVSIIGSTCEVYWRIALLHQEFALGNAELQYQSKLLAQTIIRHETGGASQVDVNQAKEAVSAQAESVLDVKAQLQDARQDLTLLLDGKSWPESQEPQGLPDREVPEVSPGLPADILRNRPDLVAAEERLREVLINYDLERISQLPIYPSITLTSATGGAGYQLKQALGAGTLQVNPEISFPFLSYPTNVLSTDLARELYKESTFEFRKTVWQALHDVENLLSTHDELEEQAKLIDDSVTNYGTIETQVALEYSLGAVSSSSLYDAQQNLRNAKYNHLQNMYSRLVNQASIFQGLGGG